MKSETSVKIGIVLPEDNRKEIFFKTPSETFYRWESSGAYIPLEKGQTYSICQNQTENLLLVLEGKIVAKGGNAAQILSDDSFSVESRNALEVKNIIAGRNFHWKKEITQNLPGNFLITVKEGHLVLVNILPLELYIACVAVSEMSPQCPEALLKAQMVVARSWFLAHAENKHSGWDACNDDCCQRYQGIENLHTQLIPIALSTEGQVLIHEDRICDTRYSKCCGGIVEDASHVWKGTCYPYLTVLWDRDKQGAPLQPDMSAEEKAIEWISSAPPCFCSPDAIPYQKLSQYLGKVDTSQNYYRWEQRYSASDILELLQKKGGIKDINEVLSLQPLERGNSSRIKKLRIDYLDRKNQNQSLEILSEYQIRNLLHPSFLYSSAFFCTEERDSRGHLVSITLKGAGWGHGVGLCQMGALGMSLQGYSYEAILSHYFPYTILSQRYSKNGQSPASG